MKLHSGWMLYDLMEYELVQIMAWCHHASDFRTLYGITIPLNTFKGTVIIFHSFIEKSWFDDFVLKFQCKKAFLTLYKKVNIFNESWHIAENPHPKYPTELELSSYSMVSAWVSNIVKTYSHHGSHQTCFIQYHVCWCPGVLTYIILTNIDDNISFFLCLTCHSKFCNLHRQQDISFLWLTCHRVFCNFHIKSAFCMLMLC